LTGKIELGVDLQRLTYVDRAVWALRCKIELTIAGMSGPGVIPGSRAFLRTVVQRLDQHNP
jgi:hypothetical protein